MKFLRTIRFDPSDENVFDRAAGPDEWAISGAFEFVGLERENVVGKTKQAFANGFLSLESFGRSTFASVAELGDDDLENVERCLARHFVERYDAPDEAAALPVAREEAQFVLDLCKDSLVNTIFTVQRRFADDGQIKEEFRTIAAPDARPMHTRIWNVVEDNE
ncbi:MAG: DUF6505 family protein [Hyphomicrobiaceae bacterium]|nr:DUF6505 family protein [Hyphomicrobiaceae bacterium]